MKKVFYTIIILFSCNSFAQMDEVSLKHFNLNKKNVAISGYDPVSYFYSNPKKVKSSIQTKYEGVIYYFENERTKDKFIESPNKYMPQYGGWCAYALANKGELMNINPKTYKITDGKLYLFYDKFLSNTLGEWNKDEDGLKIKADNNWDIIIED